MSMQSTDPIADLLTRIRNAMLAGKNEVRLPASKIKIRVAEELKNAGYLAKVTTEKGAPRDTIVITIAEEGKNPTITEIARVSKPGRRVYKGASEIPRVKSGRGIVLVSTSQGIMTGQQAKKNRLGGELLCEVY